MINSILRAIDNAKAMIDAGDLAAASVALNWAADELVHFAYDENDTQRRPDYPDVDWDIPGGFIVSKQNEGEQ
jgi:hypothetical protein